MHSEIKTFHRLILYFNSLLICKGCDNLFLAHYITDSLSFNLIINICLFLTYFSFKMFPQIMIFMTRDDEKSFLFLSGLSI